MFNMRMVCRWLGIDVDPPTAPPVRHPKLPVDIVWKCSIVNRAVFPSIVKNFPKNAVMAHHTIKQASAVGVIKDFDRITWNRDDQTVEFVKGDFRFIITDACIDPAHLGYDVVILLNHSTRFFVTSEAYFNANYEEV